VDEIVRVGLREGQVSAVVLGGGARRRAGGGVCGRSRWAGCGCVVGVVLVLGGLGVLAPGGAWAAQACRNEGVRAREPRAVELPDCRAYVQVTPVEKGGVDAEGFPGNVTASADGDRVRYYSPPAFDGTPSPEGSLATFYVSSRLACEGVELCDGSEAGGRKGAGEWSTAGVLPFNTPDASAYGFSEDLSQSLLWAEGSKLVEESPLAGREFEETPVGEGSFYLRESSSGIYRLLLAAPEIWPAGFSGGDGRQLIFEAGGQLLPGAAAGALNVYEIDTEKPAGEQLSLAGVLPAAECEALSLPVGCAPAGGSIAGAGAGGHLGTLSEEPHYTQSAISSNGSRVFFTAKPSGRIYARLEGKETLAISNGAAEFLQATPEGSAVFYIEEGRLFRYELESKAPQPEALTEPAAGVLGTLGVSEDGSSAFFAATGVLAANSRLTSVSGTGNLTSGDSEVSALSTVGSGSFFTAGQEISGEGIPAHTTITAVSASTLTLSDPATKTASAVALSALKEEKAGPGGANLYEWQQNASEPTFIAQLTNKPEVRGDEGDWRDQVLRSGELFTQRSSRVAPDGDTLLFSSRRSLSGYDNGDDCLGVDGPCQELFRYRTPPKQGQPGSLACVSCGVPGSESSEETYLAGAAGLLSPTNEAALTRNLSENGQRVFFQTTNPLIPGERNSGVYEWEAVGEGSCHSETQNGGCLSLIANGGALADASANGNDVFFFTREQLAETDTDQNIDLYDACVECGKEPSPQNTTEIECRSGEQCHPPTPPQTPTTPSSATLTGTGNLTPPPATPPPPKLTNAQLLAKALKACKTKHNKHKRTTCETQAHRHYPTKTKKPRKTTHHPH
jgi:hypothetical protein